jgi:hypothetical protein
MSESSPSRALTRRQFDRVIRRAAELTAKESDSGSELAEADLFRIAQEVGLPEHHVRMALSEIRSGVDSDGLVDRVYGPARVVVSRVVSGSPKEVARQVDEFLVGGQLLQRIRRTAGLLQYRPAVDWISQLARAASSTSRRYYIASAKSVEVRLDEVEEGRTLVSFEVDPGIRGEWLGGGIAGGAAGGTGLGVGTGFAVAAVAPELLAVGAGIAAAGGFFVLINRVMAHYHRKKWLEVRAEVEGVLDQLESGESLEPPPPSWRRWVERQFHGARRLFDREFDDEGDDN